jgi:hypothetical protein
VPFYLYTGSLLVGFLIVAAFAAGFIARNIDARFVSNPKVGDVYLIRNESPSSTSYYFLKITRISGDSVLVYRNNLEYSGTTSELAPEDYFSSSQEIGYTRELLQEMHQKGFISSVERGYDEQSGFNRVKS